ncbi:MAG: undecaprenyl/decaprenyl-phosphate alpha-N-acetylglucosaminyl 1-phosphate transferase [Helicobacter sp.]|nr:undecaprenyl/decaprenyl-phosphate alpha-N-acetylglucosaminyl 1-phosphate transferase [Helicobacter sp.]MCI7485305.1 undecaprenyl/decaprenyl-phosphate alpha-N-acetylglucosaminyl 1-phosphate transferase [Helicobacter sp.]MDD7567593.1 MraY family glycosyltransferase [Helicobacter sp.]MDY5740920.1 MraY family glycosyltransferase [Helicobacter sp.]
MINEFILFSSAIAFFMSFGLCLLVIIASKRLDFFMDSAQSQKPQRFHTHNTSRAGGVGIFVAFYCAYLFYFGYDKSLLGLLFGAFVIFISGLAEDFSSSLNPKIRLILQCFGAFLGCYMMSVYLKDLSLGFELPRFIGVLFSIFALVGVTNAINIIDGFNGLASGICLLIFGAIAFVAFAVQDNNIAEICIFVIMAILGFFVLNFPKGKIFLGDGGAYFLGFLAGFLLILLTQKNTLVSTWFGFSIMVYPVWEVLFSIYRKKVVRGISPMEPDKAHFHMLLFKRVFKNNASTSLGICLLYAPFVVLSCLFFYSTLILLAISLAFIVLYIYIYWSLIRFAKK